MKLKLMCLSLAVALTGCTFEDKGFADIEEKISEFRTSTYVEIEPIPEFQPTVKFAYTAHSFRGLFEPSYKVSRVEEVVEEQETTLEPDPFRTKEMLESYEVEELEYVGVFGFGDADKKALVITPEGNTHLVGINNYIGKNHGRIAEINEDSIKIIEIVTNGVGWIESPRSLIRKSRKLNEINE